MRAFFSRRCCSTVGLPISFAIACCVAIVSSGSHQNTCFVSRSVRRGGGAHRRMLWDGPVRARLLLVEDRGIGDGLAADGSAGVLCRYDVNLAVVTRIGAQIGQRVCCKKTCLNYIHLCRQCALPNRHRLKGEGRRSRQEANVGWGPRHLERYTDGASVVFRNFQLAHRRHHAPSPSHDHRLRVLLLVFPFLAFVNKSRVFPYRSRGRLPFVVTIASLLWVLRQVPFTGSLVPVGPLR